MLGHLAFLAAAVPLASAQLGGGGPGPITRESTGCTSLSFTMPSWFVTDLAYSKATGDATFNLQNRASNFTASLACSGTAACTVKSSNPGGTVLAYLQVADESASVTVNQTWTCTDRTNVVVPPFVAVGNATVKLDCKDSSCTAVTSPLLVKASLLAPVSVTPSGAIGPTGHATPGCASKTPTWKLSDIYMDSDTKLNNDGRFNFLLTNVVTGYEASCFNQVMRQTTLSCVGNEFGSLGFDQYRISTVVSFNNETKNFTVTQSWFCDDVDQSKPVRVTATGSGIVPLECKTNPLDVEGKDTKTICGTAEPVIVTGTFTGSEPLPPYSIGARVPGPDDCTITSILRPAWTFSDAWVTTTKDNVTTIQFFIIMRASTPGFQGPISVTQGKPVKGNETWFECELGDGGNTGSELWPTKCTMKFDPATKTLSLDAEWACNDLDPDHPVKFSGSSTTTITAPMECDTDDAGETLCVTASGTSWSAPISGVKWS